MSQNLWISPSAYTRYSRGLRQGVALIQFPNSVLIFLRKYFLMWRTRNSDKLHHSAYHLYAVRLTVGCESIRPQLHFFHSASIFLRKITFLSDFIKTSPFSVYPVQPRAPSRRCLDSISKFCKPPQRGFFCAKLLFYLTFVKLHPSAECLEWLTIPWNYATITDSKTGKEGAWFET